MPATGQPTQTYSYDAAGNRTSTGTLQALIQENATSGLTYSGSWTQRSNASASGGAYKDTGTVGAYVDFSFSGTAVDYLYRQGGYSQVRVILDPGPNQQVLEDLDQCPGPSTWQAKRSYGGLAGVAPVEWTPEHLGLKSPGRESTCQAEGPTGHTRQSTGWRQSGCSRRWGAHPGVASDPGCTEEALRNRMN